MYIKKTTYIPHMVWVDRYIGTPDGRTRCRHFLTIYILTPRIIYTPIYIEHIV